MAQDLIKISLAAFELQLPSLSFPALKNLYEDCIRWKRENGDKVGVTIPQSVYLELERKQTKIIKEMRLRKGRLGQDFIDWDRKLAFKMKRWR